MNTDGWPTRRLPVASLMLDARNPRLGGAAEQRAPADIIQFLFDHDKAIEIAESIATRGYFPNEPVLAIREGDEYVVVEGNRRLAAMKALKEPGLLSGPSRRGIERLAKQIADPKVLATVPVTIAPTRRSTDRQVAGRHVGTPVLPWQAENRARFILSKLQDGYTNDQLRDQLGFSLTDIQDARQTSALAEMARALELPAEVRAKLDAPRAKLYSTIERIFASSVGREFFSVAPDPEYGLRGSISRKSFVPAFTKLVTDIALGRESSRTLNKNEDIQRYLSGWSKAERPGATKGSFVPADIIGKGTPSSPASTRRSMKLGAQRKISGTVLPKDFKVKNGSERLIDIRNELTRLKRDDFPNAGAVLLRVFLELSVVDFLKRTGDLDLLVTRLRGAGDRLPFGIPTMKSLAPEVAKVAKRSLPEAQARSVEKALRYDAAAPFTVSDLHSFVHQASEFPSDRDILQFWKRTEPLFRLMLERDLEAEAQ
jgi:ParB-like chromosome segregation protein Spo0J